MAMTSRWTLLARAGLLVLAALPVAFARDVHRLAGAAVAQAPELGPLRLPFEAAYGAGLLLVLAAAVAAWRHLRLVDQRADRTPAGLAQLRRVRALLVVVAAFLAAGTVALTAAVGARGYGAAGAWGVALLGEVVLLALVGLASWRIGRTADALAAADWAAGHRTPVVRRSGVAGHGAAV